VCSKRVPSETRAVSNVDDVGARCRLQGRVYGWCGGGGGWQALATSCVWTDVPLEWGHPPRSIEPSHSKRQFMLVMVDLAADQAI
jgi:hypothetical protein